MTGAQHARANDRAARHYSDVMVGANDELARAFATYLRVAADAQRGYRQRLAENEQALHADTPPAGRRYAMTGGTR